MNEPERQAEDFHGLVKLLNDLGGAAENVFSRLHQSIFQRQGRLSVDAEKLRRYQDRAEEARERARLQTLEIARLTGVLGVLDEGIIMQNAEGRIIMQNEAARRLIGSSKNFWQSALGQMFREAHGMPPVEQRMQMVGKPVRVPINNYIVGVKLAAINNEEGEHLGTVMMLRDVTEDLVSNRLKDSFMGHISHELRTPLTSIKGMSDVLLNTPQGKPPKRSFLEAINRNVSLLDRMVVELLDISEISTGSFELKEEALQLDDLTFHVLKGFEGRISAAELTATGMVINPRALQLKGDVRRLQWALGHLVDNAVNYTLPGGDIALRMGRVHEAHVLLEVQDSGVGIQARDLPRIFERFFRGEARAEDGRLLDPRGLGQGLFIAQHVVEAHGGYIAVNSALGQGSTFTVALPLAG